MKLSNQEWLDYLESTIKVFEPDHPGWGESQAFHADIRDSKQLFLAIGDSWTFGDGGLENRLDSVYGRLVSEHYGHDWINIGGCGYSNCWILDFAKAAIKKANELSYDKINVVISMTEGGRDIGCGANCKLDYRLYPTEDITAFDDIHEDIEKIYVEKVKEITSLMDSRHQLVIGQAFGWHPYFAEWLDGTDILHPEMSWTELLADQQGIPRPVRTNIVYNITLTGECGVERLFEMRPDMNGMAFKEWLMGKIDLSLEWHEWLQNSTMNFEIHPTAIGHRHWADKLIEILDEAEG